MSRRILIGLLSAGTIVGLSLTDAGACTGSKHLSAAERAKSEREMEAHRKAVQAENISALDKMLPTATVPATDRNKAKALRDRAADLNKAGRVDEANGPLREAWSALGHPELYRVVLRLNC